ncbi:MAG: LysM peptidoglycan-binding domain-containing protein [Akkermansiaceae bacterium]
MKNTTTLTIAAYSLAAIALSSCGTTDPEYKEWKKKKAEEAAAANNPYGAPAAGSNPYGTPQASGDLGTTRAASGTAPYQPLPGVPQPGAGAPTYPEAPTAGAGAIPGGAPTAGGASHTVVSGDSLWGLARKYGTSIEAIQAANGLTNTNIRTGQTLTIPGR